ncbi:NAD-dependent epimerase/dehydratase family protein [Chloroflexota bacterium]
MRFELRSYFYMLAAITGASGHLGANLIRALISRGWKVTAIVHCDTRALEGLPVDKVAGDVLDEESLNQAFKGADVVFHLAARISVVRWDRKQVEAINIAGVQSVVNACVSAGVKRLVYTSSFHAHIQEPLEETLDESRPLIDSGNSPPYNRSKAEGERIVQTAVLEGLDAIIIIPAGMIGPFDFQPSHFGATLLAMAQGRLPVIVDAGLNWVDTRDVADAMINACEFAKNGEKYILGGHWANLTDIAQQVAHITKNGLPKIILPLWLAKPIAPLISALDRIRRKRPLFTSISIKELNSNRDLSHVKASKEIGYKPRPLQDTITDTIDWFKVNGLIH